jgi:pantetheine-phosphate adenylyltransferase
MTTPRIGLYTGTFDPPTQGHLWMITQAARLLDEVVVAVAVNPEKQTLFSVEEREAMLRALLTELSNVRVKAFPAGAVLVKEAARLGAGYVVRGIRSASDFDYEYALRQLNADLNPDVQSLFLIPPRELAEVSSTRVRGLVGLEGWVYDVARYVPASVLERLVRRQLTHRWTGLLESVGADAGQADATFQRLLAAYAAPPRHYHTLLHLEAMLSEFTVHRALVVDPHALELAVWFHDYVFDPLSTTKEVESAELAAEFAEWVLGWPRARAEGVRDAIRATSHTGASPASPDIALLLDADLAILGQAPDVFDAYDAAIGDEYTPHVPRPLYAKTRAASLRELLARPHLYHTAPFRTRYEAPARENLARALARLADEL